MLVKYIHIKIKDNFDERYDNLYIIDYIDNKELFTKLYQKIFKPKDYSKRNIQ